MKSPSGGPPEVATEEVVGGTAEAAGFEDDKSSMTSRVAVKETTRGDIDIELKDDTDSRASEEALEEATLPSTLFYGVRGEQACSRGNVDLTKRVLHQKLLQCKEAKVLHLAARPSFHCKANNIC